MSIRRLDQAILTHEKEYEGHEAVFELHDPTVGLHGFIAIHCKRGTYPSLGATRLWSYPSHEEAINDALRLSRLMSYKSASVGLPYGGAKAVLMKPEKDIQDRALFFRRYAEHVNELKGVFVTGSDVGVAEEDVETMRAFSPYIIGAGVPAAFYTAVGVLHGIEVVSRILFGSSDLKDRTFAIQGMGKTGFELFKLLYARGARICISDIDAQKVAAIADEFPGVTVITPDVIHAQPVDIFCPCALSGVVNNESVDTFRCRAIVGSANNQLRSHDMGRKLEEASILYAPDYIVNSGGILSVVDQFEHGTHADERIQDKLRMMRQILEDFLTQSRRKKIPVTVFANEHTEKDLLRTRVPLYATS